MIIEKNPKVLREYGRAVAHINAVEFLLTIVITQKAGISEKAADALFSDMMIGKKIEIVKKLKLVDSHIVKHLWKLNEKRKLLAHGVTSVTIEWERAMKDQVDIVYKKQKKPLTEEFLSETTNGAKEIFVKLFEELCKFLDKPN